MPASLSQTGLSVLKRFCTAGLVSPAFGAHHLRREQAADLGGVQAPSASDAFDIGGGFTT